MFTLLQCAVSTPWRRSRPKIAPNSPCEGTTLQQRTNWGKSLCKAVFSTGKPVISFYTLLCGFLHCLATGQPIFCRRGTWTHREGEIARGWKDLKAGERFFLVVFGGFCNTSSATLLGPESFSWELGSESIELAMPMTCGPCAWAFHLMPSTPTSSHRRYTGTSSVNTWKNKATAME